MLDTIVLVIRAFQFLFAIIVVGLTGHIASMANSASPSRINFMIFTAAWTLLVLIYLTLTPRFLTSLANVFAIFALDALTMLFWFAAFVALAVLYHDIDQLYGFVGDTDRVVHACSASGAKGVCQQIEASVVFGAFEWALFAATTVLAALDAFRNRNKGGGTGTV
ncbi:hypothetical protein G7Y79_00007g021820 [Physcia stellaris]|nr:hypothetical protein G7Y79_00007g021820 [Physcia stellaris]